MNKKFREEMEALDRAAEKAGGYVIPPWELEKDPEWERDFARLRDYSIEHKLPMSQFTKEDYLKLGINPPKTLFPD